MLPPARIGDSRLRTMPPTWNNGIMLKQTSLELRPQEAMTHTAPTASVSRVYDTVFFLPLHAFTRQITALGMLLIPLRINDLDGWPS